MTAPYEKDAGPPSQMNMDRFIPYLLNRIVNRLNLDLLEALRPLKITPARWRVLAVLMAEDGRSMTELAVYCVMEQSTLTRVVDQMERDGLALRRSRADDNRVIEVFITARGRKAFQIVYPVAVDQANQALKGFSAAEFELFVSLLYRMLDNVRRTEFV